ncbi:uncharacterized protein [Procambarus clarkii]|uniref:uncharacterized protein isoform X2 n=1 Tax=Procambarus clarkii TaxID=6728 RepID=UPI003742B687
MASQVVDPSGQASQEARRRAVWRGPAWGEVLLSARLIGFTKLVTWTVLCMRLPAPGLQVCPREVSMRELQVCTRVHQYNGTAGMINQTQEIGLVQRHCRYGGIKVTWENFSRIVVGHNGVYIYSHKYNR